MFQKTFSEKPSRSFFLFGPRGVGKSKQIFTSKDALWVKRKALFKGNLILDNDSVRYYDAFMRLNEKNIFLLDGSGAILSAIISGLVLPIFSQWIGLPTWILYCLAILGLGYGIYSLSCFLLVKQSTPLMLLAIMAANVFYCLLATALVFTSNELTTWGRAYLISETAVILSLIVVEAAIYRKGFIT